MWGHGSAEAMRRLSENFLTPAGTVGRSDEDDIVVVSDLPSKLPQLKQIIEQADQPVAQVLVDARIIELEISNDLTRDVNMGIAQTGASDSMRKIFQAILAGLGGQLRNRRPRRCLHSREACGRIPLDVREKPVESVHFSDLYNV